MPSVPRSSTTTASTSPFPERYTTRSPTLNFGGSSSTSLFFLLLFLAIGPPPFTTGTSRPHADDCSVRAPGRRRGPLRPFPCSVFRRGPSRNGDRRYAGRQPRAALGPPPR